MQNRIQDDGLSGVTTKRPALLRELTATLHEIHSL